MQGSNSGNTNLAVYALVGVAALSLCFAVLPRTAFADVAKVQTEQILPEGGVSCQQLSVSSVQPYIYNGALHSFDVVLSNSSYVSVAGEVGDTSIPFYFMGRTAARSGGVRIHVDIPTSFINGSLPVSLTLLSAPAGQPVCASIVSFSVMQSGEILAASPIPQTNTRPSNSVSSTPAGPGSKNTTTSSSRSTSGPSTTSMAGIASGTATVTVSVVGNTFASTLSNVCAGNGAYRLWLVLLVLYLIIVGAVIFSRPAVVNQTTQGAVAAILVPLILLIALWYFAPACRGASLLPLVACFIGIGGLFIAFGEQKEDTTVIALPEKM